MLEKWVPLIMPYYSAHSDKKINQLCLTRVTPNSLGLTNLPSGSGSNWIWICWFLRRGKPEYPEKNLSEQGREPTTNSTHIWHRDRESNLGQLVRGKRSDHCAIPAPLNNKILVTLVFYFALEPWTFTIEMDPECRTFLWYCLLLKRNRNDIYKPSIFSF